MTRIRKPAVAAAFAAVALLVTSCSGGSSSSGTAPEAATELKVSVGVPPLNGLDPALAGRGPFTTFLTPAYEPLVRVDPDGTLTPALATAWETSEDGTQLTFTLREDAAFSDGTPVDAAAAAKSILYWKAANGPFANQLKDLTSAEATGEFELTLTNAVPFPDMVYLFQPNWLAGDIMSPAAVDAPESMKQETFGAGPYVLDSSQTVSNTTYVYVPNEHYYDQEAIAFDQVTVTVNADPNSAIQAMKTGQTNLMLSDAVTANSNAANLGEGINVVKDPGTSWFGLVLIDRDGSTNPVMGDVRVRQAMNYALDRELIADALYGDYGSPQGQINGEGWTGYDAANSELYSYDPEKAKSLLKEAGLADGVTIKNIMPTSSVNSTLVQAITSQLAEVGITLETDEVSTYGELTETVNEGGHSSMVYGGGFDVPALNAGSLFGDADGGYNPLSMHDAELDALLSEAQAAGADTSDEAWKAVYTWVTENAWWVVAAQNDSVWFASDSVNFEAPGAGSIMDLATVTPAE